MNDRTYPALQLSARLAMSQRVRDEFKLALTSLRRRQKVLGSTSPVEIDTDGSPFVFNAKFQFPDKSVFCIYVSTKHIEKDSLPALVFENIDGLSDHLIAAMNAESVEIMKKRWSLTTVLSALFDEVILRHDTSATVVPHNVDKSAYDDWPRNSDSMKWEQIVRASQVASQTPMAIAALIMRREMPQCGKGARLESLCLNHKISVFHALQEGVSSQFQAPENSLVRRDGRRYKRFRHGA